MVAVVSGKISRPDTGEIIINDRRLVSLLLPFSHTTKHNMDFSRGERVHFDLDTGDIESAGTGEENAPVPPAHVPSAFVGDILERTASTADPPVAPTFKANTSGFPAHKKRTPRVSTFKQQRVAKNEIVPGPPPVSTQEKRVQFTDEERSNDNERVEIDQENKRRLAAMSEDEIEEERNELFASLPPSLIQKLLARANLDEASNERELFPEKPTPEPITSLGLQSESRISNQKKVSFQDEDIPSTTSATLAHVELQASKAIDGEGNSHNIEAQNESQLDQLPSSIHFPKPPQPPELDPNSPSFLEDLHEKYFPNLAYDPSSLSWMKPIDSSDTTSPYHPSQVALNANELRFDFKGALLAPSKAREIPVMHGLHHHAEAPEAAGYTIPELAILARSAVAAQRCMAYQTLGRFLYRLGQGEFGVEKGKAKPDGPMRVAINPDEEEEAEIADDEDAGSAMASGLWKCVEEGRIVETLTEEAGKERGHLTARTYAQEALWNWRRGGGRKRQAV